MDLITNLQKYTEYSLGKTKEKCSLIYQDVTINNIDFSPYDLNNSSFLEITFNNCDFSKVYLSGASLCGSIFNQCIFLYNTFKKGNADYTEFISTEIKNMDSFRTSYNETSFQDVKIIESQLERSYFDDSKFTNVTFINTNFIECSFNNSKFDNVIFIGCHFEQTNFQNIMEVNNINFNNVSIKIEDGIKTNLNNEIRQYFNL